MRRIISICCVFCILFLSLAAPARAADLDEGTFINVLEYATANNSGRNLVYSGSDSNSATIVYDLPYSYAFRSFDLLIISYGYNLASITVNGYSFTPVNVYSRYYRVYGSVPSASTKITIEATGAGLNTGFLVLGLTCSSLQVNHFPIEGYCSISATGYSGSDIHYVPTDDVNHRSFMGSDDPYTSGLTLFLWSDLWKSYDYLDIQLFLEIGTINSISCVFGNVNIPIEVSYLDPPSYIDNQYYVNIRVPLFGLNKSSNDYPMVIITGSVIQGHYNLVSVMNMSGTFVTSNFSVESYWMQKTYNLLTSFSTNFSDFFAKFNTFSTNFSNFSTKFNTFSSNFNSFVTGVYSRFTSVVNTINTTSNSIISQIKTTTTTLGGKLDLSNTRLSEIKSAINTMSTNLENAIRGDTTSGDDFQDQVIDKDEEFDDMAAVMDSVTKPDIDDIDVSIDSFVDPADVVVLATPLTVFLEADLFRTMIIMSILLATVSYTLYGKR